MDYGKKVWVFPDAELPPEGTGEILGHESIIITNTGVADAHIQISLLYADREPVRGIRVLVEAQRVRCLRTNVGTDFGGHVANEGEQYAMVLESDMPVVAQYGRAEPRRVAFYTTPGYSE